METIILSPTMQAFIASGVPEYGGNKPFTLTQGTVDFEAVSWWNVNEYYTVGVVLTDMRHLLQAIVAMHDYINAECRDEDLAGFPYYMALIIPPSLFEKLKRFAAPECFELYVIDTETVCYIGARDVNKATVYTSSGDFVCETCRDEFEAALAG